MTKELVDTKTGEISERKVSLSVEDIALLKATVCKDHTDDEVKLFARYCEAKGLDPFGREIYSIKRQGKPTFQMGIDGLRAKAEESGEYDGQETEWCGEDGVWKDIWISGLPPYAARVKINRKGCEKPFVGIALWTEYKPATDDWMWKKMPSSQLAKCAEAIGFRKAFPRKLGGIYSAEEMQQAGGSTTEAPKIARPKPLRAEVKEEVKDAEIVESRPEEYSEPPIGASSEPETLDFFPGKAVEEKVYSGDVKAAMDAQAPAPEKTEEKPKSKFFAALHASARKAGITDIKMKAAIKLMYSKDSSKDLTDKECAELIKLVDKGGIR